MKREPFAIIPLSVLNDERLSGRDVRVYAALSTFSDKEGRCWPSHKTIAERCGIRAKDIAEHTARLVACGHLTMTRRGKRQTNTYTLQGDTLLSGVSPQEGDTPFSGVSDTPFSGVSSNHTQLTPQGVAKKKRKRKKTLPPSPVTEFLAWWPVEYQKRFASPYVVSYDKEGGIIKRLLTALLLEELKRRALFFFSQRDDWIQKNGHTVANFAARINRLSNSDGRKNEAVQFLTFDEAVNV
jgi:Helix-turn-helix domain